jgi:hypothetical protein
MEQDNLQIRIGTPDDVHEVMKLAIAAVEENAFLDATKEKLLYEVWPALNQDRGIIGLIGPPNGAIEGMLVLRVGTLYYSEQLVIEEKVCYVKPEFRSAKGGRARKLCEFGKEVSRALNLPITIGVLSNQRTAAKMKMYERIFGPPAGCFFLWGAETIGHKVLD